MNGSRGSLWEGSGRDEDGTLRHTAIDSGLEIG